MWVGETKEEGQHRDWRGVGAVDAPVVGGNQEGVVEGPVEELEGTPESGLGPPGTPQLEIQIDLKEQPDLRKV